MKYGVKKSSMDTLDRQKEERVRCVPEQMKPEASLKATDEKTEAVLLWAHHEKAVVFEKDNSAERNRNWQEKRKSKYEME